ncbi:MAG: hypothetical protein Q9183_007869, partial [Haloplaca sp. 2 TL-2023]
MAAAAQGYLRVDPSIVSAALEKLEDEGVMKKHLRDEETAHYELLLVNSRPPIPLPFLSLASCSWSAILHHLSPYHDDTEAENKTQRLIPSPHNPTKLIFLAVLVFMNTLSRGSVRLRSNDPTDAPVIDLNMLESEYDMQVAIQAIKETMHFLRENKVLPTEEGEEMIMGPKGVEREDVE